MKPIRLPEQPSTTFGVPEIFEAGAYSVVRRAVVIGNGSPGAENQCIGLVRALGLSDQHVHYRVTRPNGGVNEWLHWLPVSVHKKLDFILRQHFGYTVLLVTSREKKSMPLLKENGGGVGLASCYYLGS